MEILVASGAFQPGEVEDCDLGSRQRLVTLTTGSRYMASRQGETCLLVVRESKPGILEAVALMALFAAISPGFAGKLAFVHILMAIDAQRELDLEAGKLTRGNVA